MAFDGEIGRQNKGAVTYWEKVAQTRWGSYISEIEKNTLLRAHNLFDKPTTALDVGCEGGRWSTLLSELGWSMIATDIDPEVLSLCKARIPSAKCILVKPSDTSLPCSPHSVDLVVAIEPDVVMQSDWIFPEVNRVLRDGGFLVSVIWNNLSWRGFIPHIKSSLKGAYDYYAFSYPEWRGRFARHGFEIIYEEGMCWFPFSRKSDSSLIPACANLERIIGLRKLTYLSPWICQIARKVL